MQPEGKLIMDTAANRAAGQSPNTSTIDHDGSPADMNAVLREALVAYWETDCRDEALRERILALPNGAAALARGEQIREAFQPFAGTGMSVKEFLREKHAEARRESPGRDH
jgi:hypothetical protein